MVDSILGIDIAKLKFDVALLQNDKYKTKFFKNNIKGFEELSAWLKEKGVQSLHVCLEATGTYGEALSHYLTDEGFIVSVVNPAQIKGFAQSELSRTKTDKADSKLIARYCRAMKPSVWKPLPLNIRELQALIKRLEALQAMGGKEINRLEIAQPSIKPCIQEMCEVFDKKIAAIKQKIRKHIDQDPDLLIQKELLKSIPGVGETTIAQILSFMGTPKRFENVRQLTAFIGLNPRHRESGSSVRGHRGMSKMGSARLRKALYFPAIVAKNHNPVIKKFCERLHQAGKPKMVIIGAAMRKLLHIIYGVLKSGKPFDANLAMA